MLEAADYYWDHFNQIKDLVKLLNDEETACIPQAKQLFEQMELKTQLVQLKANYVFLIELIKKKNQKLKDVFAKMQTVSDQSVKNKMSFILSQNVEIRALF